MTDILRDLIGRVRDLKETVKHSMPAFRWGVVTSVSPLAVQLDADTQPLAGSPTTLTTGLQAGDRVLCLQVYRKVTILGVLKGGDTGWIPFSPTAGTAQHDLAYRRIGNEVIFRGSITGTSLGFVSVFTMPAGFRPSTYQYYPTTMNVDGHATIRIGVTGLVEVWKGTGHAAGSYVSMGGVRYFTD